MLKGEPNHLRMQIRIWRLRRTTPPRALVAIKDTS